MCMLQAFHSQGLSTATRVLKHWGAGDKGASAIWRSAPSTPCHLSLQACLCDPEFMAYVDQVERIWEELEEELGLQEAS